MESQIYQQFLNLERNHWWFRGRRSVYLGLLQSHMKGNTQGPALDLGCGLGGFLPDLQTMGFDVYGADMDFESLQYCVERGFAKCMQTDSYVLPFADNSFELITLFDAIEHIEDDHRVMAEVARILKPGGKVIISVPAYQFLFANNDRVAQHFRRYNRRTVRELYEGAGLTVERNTHSNVFLFPVILPIVLVSKLLESVLDKERKASHSNLSWPMPKFVNDILHKIFAAELLVSRHIDWPAGHSIAAIASKK